MVFSREKSYYQFWGGAHSVAHAVFVEIGARKFLPGDSDAVKVRLWNRIVANYLLATVRIVTGVAMYIPEVAKIITKSAACDVTFDVLAGWVDDGLSSESIATKIKELVDRAILLQQKTGVNPLLIPGALDYSRIGSNPELDRLLGWRVVDNGRIDDCQARDICIGAPEHTVRDLIDHATFECL